MHPIKTDDHVQHFEVRRSWEPYIPWLTLCAIAAVLLTLYASDSGWLTGKASLKGYVSDGYGKLYAYTTVNLIDETGEVAYTVEVDRDGFFEVPDAEPGIYTIQLNSATGPYSETQTLELKRNTTEEISIFLEEEDVEYDLPDDSEPATFTSGYSKTESKSESKKSRSKRWKSRGHFPF